ncbi:MAG: type III-B CRISPR module RAMP protein Cmr1 [Thermoproteota archaeon]|jgi:CRISPR-associated protein Cmr1|nr:MAG: type III-B CRISPR module RAMP protein Cmr1 [Candidatus Korarchaeota archaeon]
MSVTLRLKSENWLLLGGYDTQFHEDDPLRTQSLKGLWRYWLRAYISGVMYEAGKLECKRGEKYVCESETKEICEKTGEILGSLKSASKFRIIVNRAFLEKKERIDLRGKEKEAFPQRIRLLSLGRKETQISYGKGLSAEIKIEKAPHVKSISENEKKLALGSLLTALSLNGLGKGGRRGLGTFSVEVDGFEGKFLRGKKIDYSMIRELINETLESARSYLNLTIGKISEMPPVDCISKIRIDLSEIDGSVGLFNKKEVPVFTIIRAKPKDKKMEDIITELQDFFYRPRRSGKMGFGIASADESQDVITRERLAWFLGLPREQRGEGYISDIIRRASPIHLAVHKEEALFTFFLSGDWPTEIKWRRLLDKKKKRRDHIKIEERLLRIDSRIVKEAYLSSISSLENYLSRLGYEYEVIYP